MEVDADSDPLRNIAAGDAVSRQAWPAVRTDVLARLDRIAHGEFPIPSLPAVARRPRLLSPLPSSPLEHAPRDADKEDAPVEPAAEPASEPAPAALPGQIADQLACIRAKLETFTADAPHTVQRLAELVLQPRAHYRALATYLHAVDRVVHVTSGTAVYPLPPAVPDMSAMNGGAGDEAKDPAATVTWSNPTTASLGSDEALGGALLTPIPWLTRRSPESNGEASGAQIHSEGTETIEGPNGVGSIETVSVSVNGVPSTGHARGVTQGELLRQEQRAGVVPVSQLSRGQEGPGDEDRAMDDTGGHVGGAAAAVDDEDGETPHARGPEEIGVGDTGPQGVSTSYFGEDGVQMQGIDVEAAVGRRHDDDAPAPAAARRHDAQDAPEDAAAAADGPRAKREADQELEAEAPKKARESDDDEDDEDAADGGAPSGGSPLAVATDADADADAAKEQAGEAAEEAAVVAAAADGADAMEET